MSRLMRGVALCAGSIMAGIVATTATAADKAGDVSRGEYLVSFGGCHDCHTPKTMTPNGPALDTSRLLSGHRAGSKTAPVPPGVLSPDGWAAMTNADLTAWAGPWGISYSANLTPSPTGMGAWTEDQFIKSMRTGKHLGVGRQILPPMPWQQIGKLTDADLKAVFAYLKSIKPIDNAVPGPVPPGK